MIIERLNTLPLSVLVPLHNKMGGLPIYSVHDTEDIDDGLERRPPIAFPDEAWNPAVYKYFYILQDTVTFLDEGAARELLDIDGIEDYLLDIYNCDEFAISRYLDTLVA